jgi:hypothetical protein
MNTTTTTAATMTAPPETLRTILAALDLYTSSDKARAALTLARITPVIVEQTDAGTPRPTALRFEATNSTELVEITCETSHTLTEPALIDPAAILATMPKKSDTKHHPDAVLTLTPEAWKLEHTPSRSSFGPAAGSHTWPNTPALWHNQSSTITPYAIDPTYLGRLAKLAKTLNAGTIRHMSQGTRDGKPNNGTPLVFVIETENLNTRILIMPQRMN